MLSYYIITQKQPINEFPECVDNIIDLFNSCISSLSNTSKDNPNPNTNKYPSLKNIKHFHLEQILQTNYLLNKFKKTYKFRGSLNIDFIKEVKDQSYINYIALNSDLNLFTTRVEGFFKSTDIRYGKLNYDNNINIDKYNNCIDLINY